MSEKREGLGQTLLRKHWAGGGGTRRVITGGSTGGAALTCSEEDLNENTKEVVTWIDSYKARVKGVRPWVSKRKWQEMEVSKSRKI